MLGCDYVPRRQLQSVIGSLMFLHKCVHSTRIFVNKTFRLGHQNIKVTDIMRKDLRWFLKFTPQFNGTTMYDHQSIEQVETLHTDACLTGVGGVWKNNVYTGRIPDYMGGINAYSITHLELINILVALKTWGYLWCHQRVFIFTDNMTIGSIYKSGFTRDDKLAAFVRNVWLYTAKYDIELVVEHILEKDNTIADMLSRWQLMRDGNSK